MESWECCQVASAVIQGRVNGGSLDAGRGSGGEVDQVKRHLGQMNISSGSRSECGVKEWEAATRTPGFWTE